MRHSAGTLARIVMKPHLSLFAFARKQSEALRLAIVTLTKTLTDVVGFWFRSLEFAKARLKITNLECTIYSR